MLEAYSPPRSFVGAADDGEEPVVQTRPQTRPQTRRQIKSSAWRGPTSSTTPDALVPIAGRGLGRSHASPQQPSTSRVVLRARPFPTRMSHTVSTYRSSASDLSCGSADIDRTMLSLPTTGSRSPAATKAVLSVPAMVTQPCRPYTPLMVLKSTSGRRLRVRPCTQHLALPLLTGEPVTRPLSSLLPHVGYCPMLGQRATTRRPSRKRPGTRIPVSAAAAQGTTAQPRINRPPGTEGDDPLCRTRARLLTYWQWHAEAAASAPADATRVLRVSDVKAHT